MPKRYINQLTPEQRFWREVVTPPKKWRKVKTIADMEYSNSRMIPIYAHE